VPDKRDIHQAKSKGRHKSGGQSGSRRGGAVTAGQDSAATVLGTDRSDQDGASGARRDKGGNGR
jgi:hypothetical protein